MFFVFFLADDLEVTDPKDREILLNETAKLASAQSDESQVLSTNNDTQSTEQNTPVREPPLITLSDFDDGDNGQKSVLICDDDDDDDDLLNNNRRISNEELLNQRIINLAYRDGDDSTTDDNSERDFSFKDSEDEHDFGKLSISTRQKSNTAEKEQLNVSLRMDFARSACLCPERYAPRPVSPIRSTHIV